MRKCFLEEALRNEICIAPHYTRFFDLLKEFKKTNPNASVENLHEMCDCTLFIFISQIKDFN